MILGPVDAVRNSAWMRDGSYRSVPSTSEVGNYLGLVERVFPDGTTRLSFSLHGLWVLSSQSKFFPEWSAPRLKELFRVAGSTIFVLPTKTTPYGDYIVDAEHINDVVANSTTRRFLMAKHLIAKAKEAILVRAATQAGFEAAQSDFVTRLLLNGDSEGARRFREAIGRAIGHDLSNGVGGVATAEIDDVLDMQTDSYEVERPDLARFVPVVDREINGRSIPTVNASDMHVFLGSRDQYLKWFTYQAERCKLIEGIDYSKSNTGKIPSIARSGPKATEIIVSLAAAKEIGMVGSGPRSKELRLYFLDCERRLEAGNATARLGS